MTADTNPLEFTNRQSARPKPPHIALVTARHVDYNATDDMLLAHSLSRRGARAEFLAWDESDVEWPRFDAVVLRSTWDYHLRVDEFAAWIDGRAADGTQLFNSASTVRWNMHKEYLLDLSRGGIRIPRSLLLRRATRPHSLEEIARCLGSRRLVIKPAVSASSRGTALIDDAAAPEAEARLDALLGEHDVLVQAFVPEIQSGGEISLVFMGGELSHAVRKLPAEGEFRSQSEYGARVDRISPDGSSLDLAHRVFMQIVEQPLYARVDIVHTSHGPLLMELELIEPTLYLGHAPLSPDVLASLILRRVREAANGDESLFTTS